MQNKTLLSACLICAFSLVAAAPPAFSQVVPALLASPILSNRGTADPFIVHQGGFYYFTFTAGNRIEIWKSPTLAALVTDPVKKTIWKKRENGEQSQDIWAPEIHFLRGKWYVYYTATDGTDAGRRQYVLEAATNDAQGRYIERGKIAAPDADLYAIDGTVLETHGKLYFLWSVRDAGRGTQNIYIAPMRDPWTISGDRVKIAAPTYPWEQVGWWVNEGPAVLQNAGKTFVVYSASGGTKPAYCLGMLTNDGGDLLDPLAWRKSPVPVFSFYKGADGAVFAPGHNGFFAAPNGENWITYHGKETDAEGWGGRLARVQPFSFDPRTGVPRFGHPLPGGTSLAPPAPMRPAPAPPGSGWQAVYRVPGGTKKTQIEPEINFDGRSGVAPDTVSSPGTTAVFSACLLPRRTEIVTIQAWAQGRVVRVFADGVRLFEKPSPDISTATEATLPLIAGKPCLLRVEYAASADASIAPVLQIAWRGEATPFAVVPQSAVFPPPAKAPARARPSRPAPSPAVVATPPQSDTPR